MLNTLLGWGDFDNSTSFMSKDTAQIDKSNSIATFWLTFYGSLKSYSPGRNGNARLSDMTKSVAFKNGLRCQMCAPKHENSGLFYNTILIFYHFYRIPLYYDRLRE